MMKAILFDFGGTLDTDGIHWSEKFWEVYKRLNIPVTKKQYEASYVYSENKLQGVVKQKDNLETILNYQVMYQLFYLVDKNILHDQDKINSMEKISGSCYRDVQENVLNTIDILKRLKQNYLLGVVSNYYGNLEIVLRDLALHEYFDVIIDSELVGVKKPDPKIFQIALDKIKVAPSETLVVGDSYDRDIQPSKKIGCVTMWLDVISWTRPSITTDANYTIKSLAQIFANL